MKYLVIGKNGQLGKEFVTYFSNSNNDFLAVGHQDFDIANFDSIVKVIDDYKPDVVINCSAYNQVDIAEKDFDTAYKTNALGIYNLTLAQEKYRFFIVHYSTDYVFDGEKKSGFYTETDTTNPISQYAKTKLMGENFLLNNNKSLTLRVSWVFGEGNQNFPYKVQQWAKNKDVLMVATDEVSTPTCTKTIVEITLKALEKNLYGIFHLSNKGYTTRYDYARFILKNLNLKNSIYPAYANDFNLPAQRPKFSVMSINKIQTALNIEIEDWETVVAKYLKNCCY